MTEKLHWLKNNHDLLEAWFWIACLIPTLIWWKDSILWVAAMSIYANAKTAHGTHKAEKAKRAVKERDGSL